MSNNANQNGSAKLSQVAADLKSKAAEKANQFSDREDVKNLKNNVTEKLNQKKAAMTEDYISGGWKNLLQKNVLVFAGAAAVLLVLWLVFSGGSDTERFASAESEGIEFTSNSKAVETIKSGTPVQYPQASIGKVFDTVFDDTEWKFYEQGGKSYVRFYGRIPAELREKALKRNSWVYDKDAYKKFALTYQPATKELDGIQKTHSNKSWKLEEYIRNKVTSLEEEHNKLRAKSLNARDALKKKIRSIFHRSIQPYNSNKPSDKQVLKGMSYAGGFKYGDYLINQLRYVEGKHLTNSEKINVLRKQKEDSPLVDWMKTEPDFYQQAKEFSDLCDSVFLLKARKYVWGTGKRAEYVAENEIEEAMESNKNLNEQLKELKKETEAAKEAAIAKYNKIAAEEIFWPVGKDVVFEWIIYPDGKRFETTSFTKKYWRERGYEQSTLIDFIYN